ncbi:hypothetical protein FN976_12265 [Caenimonas sedimenti]|uniref:Uncharacterized protein n=1 Tax=Caenimonas sedimenti TaxID=2596921 RepID=A0A562ZRR6_9BURK|nr:hypothetical protein [Caenimonas sedimenti]TWO71087.1 hypothetical protein FN976_12265 [Caenimonas sedimenti]
MTKTSFTRTLLAAGLFAAAGLAQAQLTTDLPTRAGEASTFTGGAPNVATSNSPYGGLPSNPTYITVSPSNTAVLGAGPLTPVYVSPASVATDPTDDKYRMGRAAATNNVPGRAGEASTFTNGAPNVSTNN